ncbi:carboxypeptidase-like regulatory domain-containing protein [Granulicella sp. L60]|uniref:carboxypeptidase-like regulatory domain-containing protein n=1 Tax=Granulicella sp. L60 TaxID=1641866 RepID=UPI00131DFF76|nr:carboxypeptidase-like regulatory domain-containing protein [Granulicella sp. L60]
MSQLKSLPSLVTCLSILLFSAQASTAQMNSVTGAITGNADPESQIVVTSIPGGEVVGVMAKCDGSYRADSLKPGGYKVVEAGPHLSVREVSVAEGKDSKVDLVGKVENRCSDYRVKPETWIYSVYPSKPF